MVLVIGIGGSVLGPQLLHDALGGDDAMVLAFLDNTDPDGIDGVLDELDETPGRTLAVVISKSGGTKETRNAMLEVRHAYRQAGLSFPRHAVAVTTEGSPLHEQARKEKWLRTFPMWDFVGGRTSVTSAVGLLPAALQGLDIRALLDGAKACDELTRGTSIDDNPAARLALAWYHARNQRGLPNMVVLPYRDRLAGLSRYLQQLVMESLGKERNRKGEAIHHGLTVYGNKGSTDQHALVQQLRDGPADFFVHFLTVWKDRRRPHSLFVEDEVTTGDYLHACYLGTREALAERGRPSLTITLDDVDAFHLGVLIALYERTVGLYAELMDLNAYDQPGVEAGKRAAQHAIDLQRRLLAYLRTHPEATPTATELAESLGRREEIETIVYLLRHLCRDGEGRIECLDDPNCPDARFRYAEKA